MLITSTETISGKTITETLGLVKGNTIRAKHQSGGDEPASACVSPPRKLSQEQLSF